MATPLWVFALLLGVFHRVEGTHWAYGSSSWELEPENTHLCFDPADCEGNNQAFPNVPTATANSRKSYYFHLKLGWRHSFGWSTSPNEATQNVVKLHGCQSDAKLRFFRQGDCDGCICDATRTGTPCCRDPRPSNAAGCPSPPGGYTTGPRPDTRMEARLVNPYGGPGGTPIVKNQDNEENRHCGPGSTGRVNLYLTTRKVFGDTDWWWGTADVFVWHPTSRAVNGEYNFNIEYYYEGCCRLSSIRNNNNDEWWRVAGVISRFQTNSPVIQGTARVRLRRGVLNEYFLLAVHPLGNDLTYRWSVAGGDNANVESESRLLVQFPHNDVSQNPPYGQAITDVMSLDPQTGITSWIPQNNGLYAVQFTVEDLGKNGDPGFPYAAADRTFIPLDFIFEVSDDEGPWFIEPFPEIALPNAITDGGRTYGPWAASPQHTDAPDGRRVEFFVGQTGFFDVCAWSLNQNGNQINNGGVSIINPSGLPTTGVSNLVQKPGYNDGQDNPMCWTVSWKPNWGDPNFLISFLAYEGGIQSLGLYRILMVVAESPVIYVSGILRDFHSRTPGGLRSSGAQDAVGHADFGVDPNLDRGAALVSRWLGPDSKPTLATGNWDSTSSAVTARISGELDAIHAAVPVEEDGGFYDWFTTDPGITSGVPQAELTNMQRVYSEVLSQTTEGSKAFDFFADPFYPIDGELFGNEGDPHNYFFTWEINTYITYLEGDQLVYTSADDMWVFIDQLLPQNWNMAGTARMANPPDREPSEFHTHTIVMDDFRDWHLQQWRTQNPNAQIMLNDTTYRADIFYAHRSYGDPVVQISVPEFTLCDGLTQGANEFDIMSFSEAQHADLFTLVNMNPQSAFVTATPVGGAGPLNVLRIIQKSVPFSSVWYGNPEPAQLKLLNGFRTEFSFFVDCTGEKQCAEGFAFVIHNNLAPAYVGFESFHLGYAGGEKIFAIEFDMKQTAATGDPDTWPNSDLWGQISFHVNYQDGGRVSASEDPANAIGTNEDIPFMDFANGTLHTVRIDYQTGSAQAGGNNQPGWMRVYMNQNLAPVSEAQIDATAFPDMLGGVAYVGFTAGNTVDAPTRQADIYIADWSLTLVPIDGGQTDSKDGNPPNIVAGNTGCWVVQAKDACGNDIVVGGSADLFEATYKRDTCHVGAPLPSEPIDNGDGTYTFCYDPTTAGPYTITVRFDGELIKGYQVPGEYPFQVFAAPTDPTASFFRLPLPGMPWEYDMAGQAGMYVQLFTEHGRLLDGDTGGPHVFTDAASLQAYLDTSTSSTDIAAFSLARSPTFADNTAMGNAMSAFGCAWSAPGATDIGYACIGRANGQNLAGGTTTNAGVYKVEWSGQDTRTTLVRDFTILAESGPETCGRFGRLGSMHQDFLTPYKYRVIRDLEEVTSGGTQKLQPRTTFTIESYDSYGNLQTTVDQWVVNFDPSVFTNAVECGDNVCSTVTPAEYLAGTSTYETCTTCPNDCFGNTDCWYNSNTGPSGGNGFYMRRFTADIAGEFLSSISLLGTPLAESPYTIVVVPGPACLATSDITGVASNSATAGEETQEFTVNLRDCNGNVLKYENPADEVTAQVYPAADGTGYCVPANPGPNPACPPIDIALNWDCLAPDNCNLKGKYTPEQSTITTRREWAIDFTINGPTGTKSNPVIEPNDFHAPFSGPADGDCTGETIPAGEPYACIIQSRDAFNYGEGNPRISPNEAGEDYDATFSQAGAAQESDMLDGADVFTEASDGQYFWEFIPKKTGTLSGDVTATSGSPASSQDITPPSYSWTVVPGRPGIPSLLGAQPYSNQAGMDLEVGRELVAGTYLYFTIHSFDKYGNERVGGVGDAGDYLPNFVTKNPPIIPGTVELCDGVIDCTGAEPTDMENALFVYRYTATYPARDYLLSALTRDGDMITLAPAVAGGDTVAPFDYIKVIPGPSYGPNSVESGDALTSCISGSVTSFRVRAFDRYGNEQTSTDDLNNWSVKVVKDGNVVSTVTAASGTCDPQGAGDPVCATADIVPACIEADCSGVAPGGWYDIHYVCPNDGSFKLQIMIDNGVTNAGPYPGENPLNPPVGTYEQRTWYREFDATAAVDPGTSYAQLEETFTHPRTSPDSRSLRVGAYSQGVATANWGTFDPAANDRKWYIDNVRTSTPQSPPAQGDWSDTVVCDAQTFSVELTQTNHVGGNPIVLNIPQSAVFKSQAPNFAGCRYWINYQPMIFSNSWPLEFSAKLKLNGVKETEESSSGTRPTPDYYRLIRMEIGLVHPPTSDVYAPGMAANGDMSVSAGVDSHFFVQLRDIMGNLHDSSTAGHSVEVVFTKQGEQDITVQCADLANANEEFDCTVNLQKSGYWTATVYSHRGQVVSSELPVPQVGRAAGYSILVNPGPPVCDQSWVVAPSENLYAGFDSQLQVVLRDAYGNKANIPAGLLVEAEFMTGTGVLSTSTRPGDVTFIPYDDVNEARATVRVQPRLIDETTRTHDGTSWSTGHNELQVRVGGCAVLNAEGGAQDNLDVSVLPGRPASASSSLSCPQTAPRAGEDLVLLVDIKDDQGNQYRDDLNVLTFKQTEPGTSRTYKSLTASDSIPGQYLLTFSGEFTTDANDLVDGVIVSKAYKFSVSTSDTIKGLAVSANFTTSTLGCTIDPNAPYAGQSRVSGFESSVTPTEQATYTIILRDQYQNFVTSNDDVVVVGFTQDSRPPYKEVKCPEDGLIEDWNIKTADWDIQPALQATNTGPGKYEVTVSTEVAGVYTLALSVTDGNAQASTATCGERKDWIQIVCSGPPDRTKSFYVIGDGSADPFLGRFTTDTIPSGTEWTVTTTLRDQWDNPVTSACSAAANVEIASDITVKDQTNQEITTVGGLAKADWVSETHPYPYVPDSGCEEFQVTCTYPQIVRNSGANDEGVTVFTLMLTEAKQFAVVVSIDVGGEWFRLSGATEPAVQAEVVTVVPGVAQRFRLADAAGVPYTNAVPDIGTAAIQSSFKLYATDVWLNPVTTDTHTYTLRFQSFLVSYSFLAEAGPAELFRLPQACVGDQCTDVGHEISYLSSWHGNFQVTVVLFANDGTGYTYSRTIQNYIKHATCKEEEDLNYRCPDRTCQNSYSSCTDLGGENLVSYTNNPTQALCRDGSYAASPLDCPCAAGTHLNGEPCQTSNVILSPCPAGTSRCSGSHACRKDPSGCPATYMCPPGFFVCDDGFSCARTAGECPAPVSCPADKVSCWDGHCRSRFEDCPTPLTCPSGKVACSDGSCQDDRSKCPDRYACIDDANQFQCADGSCRTSQEQCPTKTTCPIGKLLCESGACADTLGDCPDLIPCGLNRVRCPDGSCQHNLLFCPAQVTCPLDAPVKCADGQCVASVASCSDPPSCPDFRCPSDGTCVIAPEDCPTPKSCPPATPLLCLDGSCTTDVADCTPQPLCPSASPLRCPDGSCRANILDCPTQAICTAEAPLKCPDGRCSVALEVCGPAPDKCPVAAPYRCPGGECAGARDLCPTHLTCPYGTVRCADGTCRANAECDTIKVPKERECLAPQIACPQASTGFPVCASSLEECPTNVVCPNYGVFCPYGIQCAPSLDLCPPAPTIPDGFKDVPCADGTWASSISKCPTPVTCPVSSPYKCWDQTCRIAPDDCPAADGCVSGYQCPNGACTDNPWDNKCVSAAGPCPPTEPVRCQDGECYATADQCLSNYPCILSTGCAYCPPGSTFCKDGTCRADSVDCPAKACEGALSYLCLSGVCAADEESCPNSVGCPADRPEKCPDGTCADNVESCTSYECSSDQCDDNLLPDGVQCSDFGPYTAECDTGACATGLDVCPVDGSGCFSADQRRCADGTCVDGAEYLAGACSAGDNDINVCPITHPYKCFDGFCAMSSIQCPPQLVSAGCKLPQPIQCADGSCVATSELCPLVMPCASDEARCPDGSCMRILDGTNLLPLSCPQVDTCPEGSSRCREGYCALNNAQGEPQCEITGDGCPAFSPNFCPETGLCVDGACPTLPNSNGCAATTPVKCANGDCKATSDECPLGDGCTSSEIKCPSGHCVSTAEYQAGACDSKPTCGGSNVVCADGTCETSAENCKSSNGCPIKTPIRCANGVCRKFSAGQGPVEDSCPTTVVCDQGKVLCTDGSCASVKELCPTIVCLPPTELCLGDFSCKTPEACSEQTEFNCPPTSPIRCPTGECRGSPNQCTGGNLGGGIGGGTCATGKVQCFDGSCKDSARACIELKADVDGVSIDGEASLSAQLCPEGMTACPSGLCVSDISRCGVIPPCPKLQWRRHDGTCGDSTETDTEPKKCGGGTMLCEDGNCREECISFDGCGIRRLGTQKKIRPYQCPNRECANKPEDCENHEALVSRRRLAQDDMSMDICLERCYSQVKAIIMDVTIDTRAETRLVIARNGSTEVMTLGIPSGSVSDDEGNVQSQLYIRQVGEDDMRPAVNPIHRSRRDDTDFNYPDVLTFPQTVISPAFECRVPENVVQPFPNNITVTSVVDPHSFPALTEDDPLRWKFAIEDTCLAKLVEINGIYFWSCVFGQSEVRRLYCREGTEETCGIGQFTTYNPNAPRPREGEKFVLRSVISRCANEDGLELGVNAKGVSYAFIKNPLLDYVEPEPLGKDDVQDNIVAIVLTFMGIIVCFCGMFYVAFRLSRYRAKYKKEKAEADRLHEEMENMEHFGAEAAQKDDAVVMSQNPLAQQITDLNSAIDEQELKVQQAQQQLRQDEAGVRRGHIDNQQSNRDKMLADLNKLKAQLAAAQEQARGQAETMEDVGGGGSDPYGDDYGSDPYGDDTQDDFGGGAAPRRK